MNFDPDHAWPSKKKSVLELPLVTWQVWTSQYPHKWMMQYWQCHFNLMKWARKWTKEEQKIFCVKKRKCQRENDRLCVSDSYLRYVHVFSPFFIVTPVISHLAFHYLSGSCRVTETNGMLNICPFMSCTFMNTLISFVFW